jgi:pilus assembly protein CpaB
MKRAQIIGLSIALGAGALAFVGMRGVLSSQPKPVVQQTERIDSVQVLVARADIPLGQSASEVSVRWQDWPKDAVSGAFITKANRANAMREYVGAIARAPVLAGEPITDTKLIKAGSGGVLAAILPAGMRAISTKITEYSAVGKLILPNDHVDVILIRRMRGRGGQDEHVSDTLFQNVRVLAIGQTIEAKEGRKGSEGNVATLELTPRQAETLALANSIGEISLVLRSVADITGDQDTAAANALNKNKERDTAIRVLRYGMKSRAYGVN